MHEDYGRRWKTRRCCDAHTRKTQHKLRYEYVDTHERRSGAKRTRRAAKKLEALAESPYGNLRSFEVGREKDGKLKAIKVRINGKLIGEWASLAQLTQRKVLFVQLGVSSGRSLGWYKPLAL